MARSLEAYLLWLFGYIMFNNTHGNSVDRILLPYAWEITDGDEDVPPYCSANARLWITTAVLVYDIAVETYCPWRVRRLFGQRQEFPVPTALEHVSRQDHR